MKASRLSRSATASLRSRNTLMLSSGLVTAMLSAHTAVVSRGSTRMSMLPAFSESM